MSFSTPETILLAVADHCGGGYTLKEALQILHDTSKRVSSLIGTGNDIYCLVSLATNDSEKHVLYPIYSPVLFAALQNTSWGSSIACSVMSAALTVVRKLTERRAYAKASPIEISNCTNTNSTITLPSCLSRLPSNYGESASI